MRRSAVLLIGFAACIAVSGCGRRGGRPHPTPASVSGSLSDRLAADPRALDKALQDCRNGAPDASGAVCAAAADAVRKRFNAGGPAYRPTATDDAPASAGRPGGSGRT